MNYVVVEVKMDDGRADKYMITVDGIVIGSASIQRAHRNKFRGGRLPGALFGLMLSEEDTLTPVPGRVSDEMMPSSVDSLEGDLGVELRGKNEDDLNDDPPAAEDLNALLGNNEVDEEDLSRPDSTSRKETSANLLRLLKKSSSKPSCRISEPRSVLHDDLEFSDEEENQNKNFDLEGLLSLSNMGKDTNEKPRTVEKNKRKSYLEHAISLDQKATNGKPRVQCSICSEILMKKSYTVHYRNMHKVKKSPWVATKNQGESLMSGEDRPKPKPLRKHSWAPIKSSNGGAMKCEICGKGMSTSSNVCRHIKEVHVKKWPRCKSCNRQFKESFALDMHEEVCSQ